jgi:putative endonuclease
MVATKIKMVYVYILYSGSLGKFYVGSTNNVERRIDQHNSGRSNFTSKGVPWKLIAKMECKSRGDAMDFEIQIKKRGINRYLQDNHLV